MKIFIFVLILVLIILLFPFRIKGKFSFDIFNNYGFLSLFFCNLKLSLVRIKFLPFKVKLTTKNKKIYLTFKDFLTENNFAQVYLDCILNVVRIKSFKLFSNIQFKDNSYLQYLVSSLFYVGFGIAYSILNTVKNFSNIECLNFANSTNTSFVINFSVSMQLNLFLVIYCFFVSIFRNLKRVRSLKNGN